MPPDKTIDTVLFIISIGLMALGTLSVLSRKVEAWFVSRYGTAAEADDDQTDQTDQTDRPDRPSVLADDLYCPRIELDRSKTAAIEVLVYNGWTTGEIRALIKGDNGAIGLEVDAARRRLGIAAPDKVTPIARRPTDARFADR